MNSALEQMLITRLSKERMVTFLQENPETFPQLLKLAISDTPPYNWRAAWLLYSVMKRDDPRVLPWVERILQSIPGKEDGHQRELIKILLKMELTDDLEGQFFDTCVNLWEQVSKQPSVRHTAFRFIIIILKKYPELAPEIKHFTQEHYLESLSPGVKNSIMRMIRQVALD